MKIRSILLTILVSLATTCFGQIDHLVFFDFSSRSATTNTNTWVDYSKKLMVSTSETNFMYYVHNGGSPLVSTFDSRREIKSEMKLVKKTPPNAVDELLNILIELDRYDIRNWIAIDVVCSSDVFFSNDRLLYGRLKVILEQLGIEVKLVYHLPESEQIISEDLTRIKNQSNCEIKYF